MNRDRAWRRFASLALVCAAITVAFVLWLATDAGGDKVTVAVDDIGEAAAALIAAVAAGLAARRRGGRTRAAWCLIGASALAWGAGELAWSYFEVVLGQAVPFPSVADIGFTLSVPLGVAGLLAIPTAPSRPTVLIRTILDGLVAASALLLISWATVLGTAFASTNESPAVQALALGYPVGDITVVTIALLVLSRTPLAGRITTVLLAAGFMSLAVADSMFAYLTSLGSFGSGNLLDTGWVAGFLLIGLAAAVPRADSAPMPEPAPNRLQATLPYVPVPLALTVAVVAAAIHGIDLGLWITALVMVSLTLLSLVLSVLDNLHLLARSRATEAAAHQASERLSQVLATSPVGLFGIDEAGTLVVCEGLALESLGIAPDQLLGRPLVELIRDRPDLVEAVKQAMTGAPVYRHLTSGPREFELRIQPRPGAGGGMALTALLIDVTARAEATRMRRESDAKSRFLSTMSHELRTPLNSILGFAQLLDDQGKDPLTAKQARYVSNIERSGRHLLALINDFLDYSKVMSGQMTVEPVPLELRPVLEESVAEFQHLAEATGISLDLDAESAVWVYADRRRLFQVLLNLLSNAIKFTPAKGEVHVRVVPREGSVDIEVTDSGIGIAPENQELIFEEFVQIDASTSRGHQGTGLGLALSRRLLALMDGTLTVRSELGAGSTFTINLCAARQPRGSAHELGVLARIRD